MNNTYRWKRSVGYSGLLSVVVLGAFATTCLMPFADARPEGRIFLYGLLGTVMLFLSFVGTLFLAGSWRHTLVVTDDSVESVGLLRTKRIDLAEVLEARWRFYGQAGKLTLRTSSTKLAIDFSDYPRSGTLELIRFFRFRFPESVQQGWQKYWQFYWRLFDRPDPAKREYFAAETRALRRRIRVWLSFATLVLVPTAIVVWWYTGVGAALGPLVFLVVTWPVAFLAKADRGRIAEQTDSRLKVNAALVAGPILLVLTFVVALTLAWLAIPGVKVVFILGYVSFMLLLVVGFLSQTSRINRAREEGATLAENKYLCPPGSSQRDPPKPTESTR